VNLSDWEGVVNGRLRTELFYLKVDSARITAYGSILVVQKRKLPMKAREKGERSSKGGEGRDLPQIF